MTGLYLTLAISDHYPAGTCWAWMEKAEKRVMSDSNISRMATLWDEQRRLAEAVRIAESWANS